MTIHPTAIIAPGANVHPSVEVGPYVVIGPHVTIGANCRIGAHCHLEGWTTLGSDNVLCPHVTLGCPPQDLKYDGKPSYIVIGKGNCFREFVTVHLAEGEGNTTTIGDGNMFMNFSHIAHNCHVGSHCIFANAATLAGHVHVGDRAVLGGFVGVHQFCHVGGYVMIGGMSKITKDVPPFVKIDGNPARVIGLNGIGLKRNGVPRESIERIRQVYRLFYRSSLNVRQALAELETRPEMADPFVQDFVAFVKASKRGIYKRTRMSGSAERGGDAGDL
ncbi:MAG: Acyl-[acyl-carrier-protein]--UDP-N-acetylglucosamine O-acyltransferase [Candidatus Ozemobacter sibiricus]|uniref:Acyl-[acyl-carrier-protein]--UDP-N-acetylglucosamine O-acyltransferase n=1 Tax=Candidatus Ozemobacter sibiricus TaxID=2268124 RepID=A0A367ZPQ8_9BACT|nr:MAG: Acyl-[acyl-carrier-protein]--UDP-N-acetylglucosamine O-acyltransferase [Candidatus Ozemobacter sibiricus]